MPAMKWCPGDRVIVLYPASSAGSSATVIPGAGRASRDRHDITRPEDNGPVPYTGPPRVRVRLDSGPLMEYPQELLAPVLPPVPAPTELRCPACGGYVLSVAPCERPVILRARCPGRNCRTWAIYRIEPAQADQPAQVRSIQTRLHLAGGVPDILEASCS